MIVYTTAAQVSPIFGVAALILVLNFTGIMRDLDMSRTHVADLKAMRE